MIIVEVGANQGQDTEKFLTDPSNILYAFEPIPALYKELQDKFGKYENFHLIAAAIDLENGFKRFNISEIADWGVSSLYDFHPNIQNTWNNPVFQYTNYVANVMCIRLDTFMELYNIQKIDYLHVDAQGNDFRVMRSLGKYIDKVESGVCEVAAKVELYDINDNTLEVVKPWLEHFGFNVRVEDDGVGKPMATITGNEVNLFFNR